MEVWLDEHPGARLVIVDVFTRIRARELKRADLYRADYEAAAELQAIAISRGFAIVAIYHTRKTEATDFVEMVQGTFGLAAGADTILVARRGRGEADATLYATGTRQGQRDRRGWGRRTCDAPAPNAEPTRQSRATGATRTAA